MEPSERGPSHLARSGPACERLHQLNCAVIYGVLGVDVVRTACVSYLPRICRSQAQCRLCVRLYVHEFLFMNPNGLTRVRGALPTIELDSSAGHLLVALRQSQASVRHDPLYATLSVQYSSMYNTMRD